MVSGDRVQLSQCPQRESAPRESVDDGSDQDESESEDDVEKYLL